jgi:hypothetical protein
VSFLEIPAVQNLRIAPLGLGLRRFFAGRLGAQNTSLWWWGPNWFESDLVLNSTELRHYLMVEGLLRWEHSNAWWGSTYAAVS